MDRRKLSRVGTTGVCGAGGRGLSCVRVPGGFGLGIVASSRGCCSWRKARRYMKECRTAGVALGCRESDSGNRRGQPVPFLPHGRGFEQRLVFPNRSSEPGGLSCWPRRWYDWRARVSVRNLRRWLRPYWEFAEPVRAGESPLRRRGPAAIGRMSAIPSVSGQRWSCLMVCLAGIAETSVNSARSASSAGAVSSRREFGAFSKLEAASVATGG